MPRFRTSRGDIKEPVRLMFFPWRMSSNFMRCVFPGIIGLSECTWIPVISSIDTVCRLLYGAFALFGTYCFVCGILTHATTHGATRTCPCIFFMFFNFNSRDHARRDQSGRYEQTDWHYFNSRAHARRDYIQLSMSS